MQALKWPTQRTLMCPTANINVADKQAIMWQNAGIKVDTTEDINVADSQ